MLNGLTQAMLESALMTTISHSIQTPSVSQSLYRIYHLMSWAGPTHSFPEKYIFCALSSNEFLNLGQRSIKYLCRHHRTRYHVESMPFHDLKYERLLDLCSIPSFIVAGSTWKIIVWTIDAFSRFLLFNSSLDDSLSLE